MSGNLERLTSSSNSPIRNNKAWCKEQEICSERKIELNACRVTKVSFEQGIYPFKGMKLTRADVEWLLKTHEDAYDHGPIDWSDEHQRQRVGLDLRGADLRGEDLSCLPMSCILGGLISRDEWDRATLEQREAAAIQLQNSNLCGSHLEGAHLRGAHLEGANLEGTFEQRTYLEKAELRGAHLEKANLKMVNLERASLGGANLQKANLFRAHMERTYMVGANLEDAILEKVHLEGANLQRAILAGVDLRGAFFDCATDLEEVDLANVQLADIHWGGANLAVFEWIRLNRLGDETRINKLHRQQKLNAYRTAIRANHQLSVILREQGFNEDAIHFAYRAQILRQQMLWQQRYLGQYLFSLWFDILTGYGYKLSRILIVYLLLILLFAAVYYSSEKIIGGSLTPVTSIALSISAFHGRGFLPSGVNIINQLTILATFAEALLGLTIEVILIATLTLRLFGK